MMKLSKYQEAIYSFAESGSGHGACVAVAGSGKTTTGIGVCSKFENGLVVAFNRHIKDEFAAKLQKNLVFGFEAVTYNAFGWHVAKNNSPFPIELNKYKVGNILKKHVNFERYNLWRSVVCRLVSMFKNLYIMPEEIHNRLPELVDRYALDLPRESDFEHILSTVYKASLADTRTYDFDDQKFMPLYLGMPIPFVPNLIIDEYQDTCEVESRLMLGTKAARVMIFGDPDQCIYSFKGTTPDAIGKFCAEYKAVELPLSICYRCSQAVVEEAKKIVPRIEASPDAPLGVVESIGSNDFYKRCVPGETILCRVTADLVSACFRFIREGKPAYVEGKEIGEQLEWFIDNLNPRGNNDLDKFHMAMMDYYDTQMSRYARMENDGAMSALEDRVETVKVLMERCDTVGGLGKLINETFKTNEDPSSVIRCMTIHKAKGLEADNVYLISPEKLPHPRASKPWMREEERRLHYVAVTRARKDFRYVKS